ncbi:MAG: hypothetical protein ACREKI_06415, partial [Gemmatimonadota bacterium]
QGLIDGALVNGAGAASRAAGWMLSRLQTGDVGGYVLAVALGALVWLGAALWSAWEAGGGP